MNRAFRGSRTAGICLLLFCFLGILALFALGLGSAWFAPARIVEAETKYKFDKHWSARANYTYLDARDGNTNKRLTGRALNTGTVELSWTDAKKDPWTATLYNQWYQNYLTSANNKSYSYSLTNFVVTKDIGKMSLYAGIDNLFNKKFDSSDSIWTDGRVWRAGAEWKF